MLKVFFLIHRLTFAPSRGLEARFRERTYVTRRSYHGIYVVLAGHYLFEFELSTTGSAPLIKITITRNLYSRRIRARKENDFFKTLVIFTPLIVVTHVWHLNKFFANARIRFFRYIVNENLMMLK